MAEEGKIFPELNSILKDSLLLTQEELNPKDDDWEGSRDDWLAQILSPALEETSNVEIPSYLKGEIPPPPDYPPPPEGPPPQIDPSDPEGLKALAPIGSEPREFDMGSLTVDTDYTFARPRPMQWVGGSFVEALLGPVFPPEKKMPQPETTEEFIYYLTGQVPGTVASFMPWNMAFGGASIPVTKGPQVKEAYKIYNKYFKMWKSGKKKQAIQGLRKAKDKGLLHYLDDAGNAKPILMSPSGALGSSKRYVTWLAEKSEKSPVFAKAIDTGVRNFLTFGAHGQVYANLPLEDLKGRGKQFLHDEMMAILFSFASAPNVLDWTKLAQHTVTPSATFLIGSGAVDPSSPFFMKSPFEETQEEGVGSSLTDRLIMGLALPTFYYASHGMSKARIESKHITALEAFGVSRAEAGKLIRESNFLDAYIKVALKPRPEDIQQVWTSKDGKNVDFLNMTREKGYRPKVQYMDLETHKVHEMTVGRFNQRYKRATTGENPELSNLDVSYNKSKKVWEVTKVDVRGNKFGKTETMKGVDAKDKYVAGFGEQIAESKAKHKNLVRSAKTAESNFGVPDKEAKIIKNALYKQSGGSTLNMTNAELKEYGKIIRSSIIGSASKQPSTLWLENSGGKIGNTLNALNRDIVLGPVAYLRGLKKSPGSRELSYLLEDVLDTESLEKGKYADMILSLEDMNFTENQIRGLQGLIDPTFKDFVPKDVLNHPMREKAVELIKTTLNKSFDQLAQHGVKVTSYRGGKKVSEKIWEALDSKGEEIILNEYNDVASIEIGDKVTDLDGNVRRIHEINSHLQQDYVHRVLTKDARKAFDKDKGFKSIIIERMVKNDEDAKVMKEEGRSEDSIREEMWKKFNKVSGWIDQLGIYGRQYSRIQDLPPEIAWDAAGNEIKLDKFNTYKKGETVDGRVIEQIIPIYETDFRQVIPRYANKVAHIISVSKHYGEEGLAGEIAQEHINRIRAETNDEIGNYVETVLREQIHGVKTPEEWYTQKALWGTQQATVAVANAALSWVGSGMKNLLLGQRENVTAFGAVRMARAWGDVMHTPMVAEILNSIPFGEGKLGPKESKYRAAKHEAALIGALEEGTHLLEMQKLFKLNPSMMYQTEALNRITAMIGGRLSAEAALDVVAGNKTAFGAGMSRTTARNILEEVFDLRNMDQIIERGHFTEAEMIKVMQRAHRVTQGSPTVEYMPRAFQNQFGKSLTLFHRMAYRVTGSLYKNAIIPASKGNIWPMMKFAAATYGASEARDGLYYFATGNPERDMFVYPPAKLWNKMLSSEVFSFLSGLFDENGGYGPAMLEYAKNFGNYMMFTANAGWKSLTDSAIPDNLKRELGINTIEEYYESLGYKGKALEDVVNSVSDVYRQAWYKETNDYGKENIPLWNRIREGWTKLSDPHVKQQEYVHKLQYQYRKDILGEDSDKNASRGAFNPRSEFYKEIESLFFSDVDGPELKDEGGKSEKVRIYEAAVMSQAHELMRTNPNYGNDYQAVKAAIDNIESKVVSMRPVPFSERVKGTFARTSKLDVFMQYLEQASPDDVPIVEEAIEVYKGQKKKWDRKIRDSKSKLLRNASKKFREKRAE